jgi:hypothetical protein
MPTIISVLILGEECSLQIEDDPSKCFLINKGVFSGIERCGYLFMQREIVYVDPVSFLKENESLIKQLSSSRRKILSTMNRAGRILKIHLNERDSRDGDLVLEFKSFSRSRVFVDNLTIDTNLELALSSISADPWVGNWERHVIPREHLETHERKRVRDPKWGDLELLRHNLNPWLPQEIDRMRDVKEKRDAVIERAEFEKQRYMAEEYQRGFAERVSRYNEDFLKSITEKKRRIARNPEHQYLFDLEALRESESGGVGSHLRNPLDDFSIVDSPRRFNSDDMF